MTDRDYSLSDSEQKKQDREDKRHAENRKTNIKWLIKEHGIAHVISLLLDEDDAYRLNNESEEAPSRFKKIFSKGNY